MTTFAFQPNNTQGQAPFQFSPVLDNATYNCVVTANFFGARYFFNLYQSNGPLILCRPLVPSDESYPINLLAGGYFVTSTMVFYADTQQIIVTP